MTTVETPSRVSGEVFDALEGGERFFEFFGDAGFHLTRRGAGVDDLDRHEREINFREQINRQAA